MQDLSFAGQAGRNSVCVLSKMPFEFDAITWLVDSLKEFHVAFPRLDYKLAPSVLQVSPPDILMVNYHYGLFRGTRIAHQLKSENSRMRLMACSLNYHERQLFRMLDAGALAFLTFNCEAAEWKEALATIATGCIFYNRYITPDVIAHFKMVKSTADAWWRNKLDEEAIMYAALLKRGLSRDELVTELNKANVGAVNNDLNNLFRKHNCKNKEEFILLVESEEGVEM
jgi:DNA-binding NarL/FixJ family response regulator